MTTSFCLHIQLGKSESLILSPSQLLDLDFPSDCERKAIDGMAFPVFVGVRYWRVASMSEWPAALLLAQPLIPKLFWKKIGYVGHANVLTNESAVGWKLGVSLTAQF